MKTLNRFTKSPAIFGLIVLFGSVTPVTGQDQIFPADEESGTRPEYVTMHLFADQSATPPVYTWSASGAITDGGNWVDGDFFWAAIPSPVVGTLHNELTLVGATGTISIRFEGLLTPTSDPEIFVLEGHWRVLRGTGGYLGLHGGGSVSTVFDFAESSASGTFTGILHGD